MTHLNKLISTIVLLFIGLIFPAHSVQAESTYYEKAKQEGKIILYTSFSNSDTRVLKKFFDKRFPGVALEIFRSGGPKVLQRVLAEHLAGKTIADVVMTKGDAIHLLVQKNLLAKFDSPERKAFADHFKHPGALWTEVYPTVHSIAYNSKMVASQDIPKHYTDLLNPKWKGKIGLNTNNFMFLYAMLDLNGKEKGMAYLKKLAAQDLQVRTGGTLTATLVSAGEFPLAVSINANNIEKVKKKGAPVDWARLEDPLYADLHPAAVMKQAPHPNAARLFVEFVISKEGQTLIRNRGRIPARSDVQPKIDIDRSKLRIISPKEGAKTKYYRGLLDDLFVKAK